MKPFKQFREECGCKDKEKKTKSKKKGNVEVMPSIPDGQKGMTTKPTNESVFAGNYQGPLYARHPDLVLAEKAVSKKQQKFMGMVRAAQKGEGASSPEVAKVASSMKKGDVKKFASTKHKGLPEKKVKKESFEGGVQKARRDYRSGTLLTFKQFVAKLTDILDEWEK
jgi:hypothetical protein|tara:strand:- start:1411 stop:1911 length:501 start_codon:yes stop_codon:yes gene_type:complete